MTTARLLVEGGGSTTRAALWCEGRLSAVREAESCNPLSVGTDAAVRNLADAVASAWRAREPGATALDSAWFCLSNASSQHGLRALSVQLLTALPEPLPVPREVWITNDIVPLLVHDGRIADRVVAICGTGTGYCAVNPAQGLCARASGLDYLLADEGGGFDLGLQGLRAVVRAGDGRGPATSLTGKAEAWQGFAAVDRLRDLVYSSAEPKVLIASFAPFVLAAAEEADPPACVIVEAAGGELVTGILAAAARAGLAAAYEVALSGSNLTSTAHPILRHRVEAALAARVPGVTIRAIRGSPLDAVARLAALLPSEPGLARILERCLPLLRTDGQASIDVVRA